MTKHTNWNEEFTEFNQTAPESPPGRLKQAILSRVSADLKPSSLWIFGKFAITHAFVGAFTLLWCPQFGLAPLGNPGLSGLLMRYGHGVCTLACGVTFLGSSALVASWVFSAEELRVLRQYRALQMLITALMTLALFTAMGATTINTFSLVWLTGALLGGLLALEAGTRARSIFASATR